MNELNSTIVRAARRALVITALAGPSIAHSAEIEPVVTLGITHTDNVFLEATDGQDETIFRVEPAISIVHETDRLEINVDYLLQAFYYEKLEEDQVFHQYDASGRAALVPELFFVEIGGSRNQTIVSPEFNIPQSNLPFTENRVDQDIYYAATDFAYPLGNAVTVQGDYRYSWVNFGDTEADEDPGFDFLTLDSEDQTANFSLDNYRRGTGITWAARYNWQRSVYEGDLPPWEFQRAWAELGFWFSPTTRFFASGGKESAWDDPFNSELNDEFWEAGVSMQSGERFIFEAAAGERTFGDSIRANLQVTFRRGSTSLSYNQTPTTENRNPYQPGSFNDPTVLNNTLSRPASAQRFIQNRLEWRIDYDLQRTAIAFAVFDEDRSDRTSATGDPIPDEAQSGITLSIDYRLGAKTTLRASGSLADREFADSDSTLVFASAGVDYTLGGRTTVSLQYDYADEDGETGAGAGFRTYVANTYSLLFDRSF